MKSEVQKDFIRAMVLCHSCIVQTREDEDNVNLKYTSTSPDDVAILKGIRSLGADYLGDKNDQRIFGNIEGVQMSMRKVMDFEFSSERAMQSVAFYSPEDDLYVVYMKGSDAKIMSILSENGRQYQTEALKRANDFARLGYRTLFYAVRYFSKEKFEDLLNMYKQSINKEEGAMEIKEFASRFIETQATLLGFVVMHDQLQTGVPTTIEKLRNAGIKIWVVTGDKFETAETIAKSANIITDNETFIRVRQTAAENPTLKEETIELAREVIQLGQDYSLIVDMSKFNVHELFANSDMKAVFLQAKSIVCARSSPKVKGLLVRLLKLDQCCVLGIGDGENDVSMIAEANVGVGVFGKEGTQATQVSDFAIGEFKILWKLILFYGRVNYMRTSNFTLLYFLKNLMFILPQMIFGLFAAGSGQTIFDGWYLTLFNTLLTVFPHFYLGVFDVDIHYISVKSKTHKKKYLKLHPEEGILQTESPCLKEKTNRRNIFVRKIIKQNYWVLYHESQCNNYFSESKFWICVIYSAAVSTLVMIISYVSFDFHTEHGKLIGYSEFSLALYIFWIISINFSFIMRAYSHDVFIILLIIFTSILPMITFIVIYDTVPDSLFYKTIANTLSNANFYMMLVLLLTLFAIAEIGFNIFSLETNQPFFEKLSAIETSQLWKEAIAKMKRWAYKYRKKFLMRKENEKNPGLFTRIVSGFKKHRSISTSVI